jgi:hypothetical protein
MSSKHMEVAMKEYVFVNMNERGFYELHREIGAIFCLRLVRYVRNGNPNNLNNPPTS